MSLLSSLPTLKATIDAHGLLTKKSLGQHFLLDANIVRRIAAFAGDLSGCTVVEIGPGPGGLTRALLEAGAKHMVVVEKDARCIPILNDLRAASKNPFEIHESDALQFDMMTTPAPRKIVANLPYNIGTELLLNWLDLVAMHGRGAFESMTLMFQKEVAVRIASPHGSKEYGRLSVLTQWLCEVRYDMELPPGAFHPPPNVSSAVITLIPRAKPLFDVEKKTLEMLLAKAFNQRRKMLRGALKGIVPDVESLLQFAGIEPTLRAEQVDVAGFGRLAVALQRLNKPC